MTDGVSPASGYRHNQLVDQERMLHLLDGKPVPDNRIDIACQFNIYIDQHKTSKNFTNSNLTIHYYQKGSAHISFKRPDLVDNMNDIIAKHYLGMLTSQPRTEG